MNSCKKKVILSLAAILLLCGVKIVASANNGTICAGNNPTCADNNSLLNLLNDETNVETDKPAITVGSNNNVGISGLFYKMIFMVLVVVLLGAAVVYMSKKLLPKLNLPGKRIQLAETIHLGPRKSIHLIKVGTKTLLVGSTNENITTLADVTDELSDFDVPEEE